MAQDNKIAVRIAQYFFNATHKRATPATMKQSIGQAKTLLGAGFSPEEIITVINELVERPPKNGFNSLGFLSYVMEETLTKHKAKEVRKALNATNDIVKTNTTQQVPNVYVAQSTERRIGNEFNQNLF